MKIDLYTKGVLTVIAVALPYDQLQARWSLPRLAIS